MRFPPLPDSENANGKRLRFLQKAFSALVREVSKGQKEKRSVIWAKAVLCREYIQKIADPDKEADTFEEILAGSTTKKQAAESFRELCEDSNSSPRKSLRFPLPPERISSRID
jgi:lipid A disaccharide synthetase